MEYKWRVEFAHVDDTVEDVSGGIHHGPGSIEIKTPGPIETDADRYAVAQAIGLHLNKTEIWIKAIIPIKDEPDVKVIDAADFDADE